ncbi:hypothetical protein K1719_006299 [Acacia pycnantha]|nr:hypothetical protein K1719_006299 [Acacia pycnantha]
MWKTRSTSSPSPAAADHLAKFPNPLPPPSGLTSEDNEFSLSARKLAAALWEINDLSSSKIEKDLETERARRYKGMRSREKAMSLLRSDLLPPICQIHLTVLNQRSTGLISVSWVVITTSEGYMFLAVLVSNEVCSTKLMKLQAELAAHQQTCKENESDKWKANSSKGDDHDKGDDWMQLHQNKNKKGRERVRKERNKAIPINSGSSDMDGLWKTPIPYLFGGLGLTMVVISVALVVLICPCSKRAYSQSHHSPSSSAAEDTITMKAMPKKTETETELKVLVIMVGDQNPTYLAKPASSSSTFGTCDAASTQ